MVANVDNAQEAMIKKAEQEQSTKETRLEAWKIDMNYKGKLRNGKFIY